MAITMKNWQIYSVARNDERVFWDDDNMLVSTIQIGEGATLVMNEVDMEMLKVAVADEEKAVLQYLDWKYGSCPVYRYDEEEDDGWSRTGKLALPSEFAVTFLDGDNYSWSVDEYENEK